MTRLWMVIRESNLSAEVVDMRGGLGEKSSTGSIIAVLRVTGSETMYCHVPVTGSKTGQILGVVLGVVLGSRDVDIIGIDELDSVLSV